MSLVSSFKKNIIYGYLAQSVTVLCNFASSVLIARLLGAAGQGEYSLYMNFMTFSTLLCGIGLSSGLVHFISSGKLLRTKTFLLLGKVSILTILATFIILAIAGYFFHIRTILPQFIYSNSTWIYIASLHIVFMLFNTYFQAILQAEQAFKQAGIVSVAGSLILLICYSSFYYFIRFLTVSPLQYILVSLLVSSFLQIAWYKLLIYKINKSYFKMENIGYKESKSILTFSSLAFVANLIQFFNYKLDIWVINYFHPDHSQLGVYALAVTLSQLVWLLPSAVHSVLYSDVSRNVNKVEALQKTEKTSILLLIYALGVSIIGYLLSIKFVPLWFGLSFKQVPEVMLILLGGIIPIAGGLALSAFFAGIQKVSVNLRGSILGLISCILFDFLLIPSMGIKGAAWASVISYNVTVIYYIIVFLKYRKTILSN